MSDIFNGLNEAEAGFLFWIQENLRSGFFNVFFNLITILGEKGWFFIALSAILLIFRRTRKAGSTLSLACAFDGLIVNVILKNIFERVRPFRIEAMLDALKPAAWIVPGETSYSFPSGHTGISFAVAFASLGVLPKKYSAILLVLATLTAISRLYLGVHYPTDIAVGILCGAAAAALSHLVLHLVSKKWGDRINEKIPNLL